jgi:phosphate transport system protein
MDITNDTHSHHISQKFNEELDDAKRHLMDLGGLVEKQVNDAIEALVDANSELAEQVQREELNVDSMELLVDQECTRILAKRQPAASDLRLVLMISKTTSDLERIGDEANKIARHAITLCEDGKSPRGYVEVRHIGALVKQMLHASLDAFARFDVEAALDVVQQDKTVDQEYKTALRELITYMMEDPRSITRVMNIMWVLRSLERIGDHARNVAEYVIYLVKGLDVRHTTVEEIKRKML